MDKPAPKPGHFLPGGEGPEAAPLTRTGDSDGTQPLLLRGAQPVRLGEARGLSAGESTVRRTARPLPTDPNVTSEYGGPPVAPLTSEYGGPPGAPLTGQPLGGGHYARRRTGSWHSNPSRSGAQFSAEPPPVKPPRRYSRVLVAGLSALVLVLLTGAAVAGFRLIDSYDTVDHPLTQPEVKKSHAPAPVLPDPTVTVTVQPVPDLVRLQKNELYTTGKVASVNCKEPAIKPNSRSAILRYYKALLPCLNRAWAPIIKKAGYTFRSPKVVLQTKQVTSASQCTGESDVAFYCPADETINISWKKDLDNYQDDPLGARVWMLDTMAHEYGHHVQNMTEMLTAAGSREGWATTKAQKLEWSRRTELQATCLAAVFLGANKKPLGFSGTKLRVWEYEVQHSGDEYNPKKVRDHGSRKSNWHWAGPAFKSATPASCNTFTAPAKKVS